MKTVRVNVAALRAVIAKNRDAHRAVFDKALVGYRKRMIEELDRRLDDVKKGKVVSHYIGLPVPEDHTDDYDRVLRMLDMHTEEDVEVDEGDFARFVMDQWEWIKTFAANTMSYNKPRQRG